MNHFDAAPAIRDDAPAAPEHTPVNGRELRFIGMSRSGNHAIINWIQRQLDGAWLMLNCAEGGFNPFLSARPDDTGRVYQSNLPAFDLEAERRGAFTRKDWLLHSYEDSFLRRVCNPEFERHHDRWLGATGHRMDVLILRDPFNLMASRRHSGVDWGMTETMALRVWKQHAREFLGRVRVLRTPRITVRYDRWVVDPGYRRNLAAVLGFRFSDAGVDEIPEYCGGSSFDGVDYQGQARTMRLFDRWRHYADDPSFIALFDTQTLELSDAIFGPGAASKWVRRHPV